jgi:8-oxo-dGTP diphosphatase
MFSEKVWLFQKVIIAHPSDNKILALKRQLTDDIRPGDWDLPGGNVDFGENIIDSITREVKEETGLNITHLKLIHADTIYRDAIGIIALSYKGKTNDTHIKISDEHSEYKWMTKEEFYIQVSSPFLKETIKKYE